MPLGEGALPLGGFLFDMRAQRRLETRIEEDVGTLCVDRIETARKLVLAAGTALSLGTAFGGWPIVRTIGRRIIRLRPIDGLASQTGSTVVLLGASVIGAPVSTTQVVASSVVGVGGGRRRWRHVRWPLVRSMLIAWFVTVPASAALAAVALIPWRWIT